jgi:hypothetical protein
MQNLLNSNQAARYLGLSPASLAVYPTFKVLKGDFEICREAISWFVGVPLAIPISVYRYNHETRRSDPVDLNKPVLEFSVSWKLIPALDENSLHEIIEDYKLLKDHYSSWAEILQSPKKTDPLDSIVMALLTDSVRKKLPPWAKRVLEIRKELN